MDNYWLEAIFSGSATPPPELESSAAVLRFVREDRDAIGYVAGNVAIGNGVKVLELTE